MVRRTAQPQRLCKAAHAQRLRATRRRRDATISWLLFGNGLQTAEMPAVVCCASGIKEPLLCGQERERETVYGFTE